MYSEVFEHFEWVMLKLQPFQSLMEYYDDISSELVGFAITKDINDFEVEFLDLEVLEQLRDKIDDEIRKQKKLFGEKGCDTCEQLSYNGICNYCKLTNECYDSKEDLVDGVMPNCPLQR